MTRKNTRLGAELTRLHQEIAQRPIRIPTRTAGTPETWLLIIGGNTLPSGGQGIKRSATNVTSATTLIDPYGTAATPDYIGRAYIYRNGIQGVVPDGSGGFKPEQVLVVNDPRALYPNVLVAQDWGSLLAKVIIGTIPAAPPVPAVIQYAYTVQYL
jgi:hypothetical protein